MRLYGEMGWKKELKEDFENRRIVLFLDGGYFQGVKSVSEFSDKKTVLELKGVSLEIEGEGFIIDKYCDGDLQLSGRIDFVKVVRRGGKRNV